MSAGIASLNKAHTILMDVVSHASLLVAALDRIEGNEPEATDCVHTGGAELAAKSIMARIGEAQEWLDDSSLPDEAGAIRHELFDVWCLAALAVHALPCDAPLYGHNGKSMVSLYPAVAAIRSVQRSADELSTRLDTLRAQEAKRAA